MFHRTRKQFGLVSFLPILLSFSFLICSGLARAQETGGDLSGGAGIFRPKNPEAKRTGNSSRPVARPTRPNPAEIEEKFEDALSDGNDARDARKFAAAEASYRSALKLKPRDPRALYVLGTLFPDHQRWEAPQTISPPEIT